MPKKVFSQKYKVGSTGYILKIDPSIQNNLAFLNDYILMTSRQGPIKVHNYDFEAIIRCVSVDEKMIDPSKLSDAVAKYNYTPRTYICDFKIRNFWHLKMNILIDLGKVHRCTHYLKIIQKILILQHYTESKLYPNFDPFSTINQVCQFPELFRFPGNGNSRQ